MLRAGQFGAADIQNIAEEIESIGKGEKRELFSRLSVILPHLLKWQFQPRKRSASWEASICAQRNRLARHLQDNPSLQPQLPEAIAETYKDAVLDAIVETRLAKSAFPLVCPFTHEQVMDEAFWPQ